MSELEAVAEQVEPATGMALSVVGSGEMNALMRSVGEARSPLGPAETWSLALNRTRLSMSDQIATR